MPCKSIVAAVSETLGLFMLSQVGTCIGIFIYLFLNVMTKTELTDGFEIELSLDNGIIDKEL